MSLCVWLILFDCDANLSRDGNIRQLPLGAAKEVTDYLRLWTEDKNPGSGHEGGLYPRKWAASYPDQRAQQHC